MEPLTHFLTGACLGRAGFNRKTALATITMTFAAEAADIDMVCYLKGPIFGFAHHRGITHTLVGIPFVAAAVLLFIWLLEQVRRWWRKRRGTEEKRRQRLARKGLPAEINWRLLYLYAIIACVSHILLDFTNNYGVRPLEPFSYHWYSWDIVFIYEPLLYVVLVGGLVLPSLFRLINEEVGAKARGPRGRLGAVLGLIGELAVWGVRDFQHRRAVAALNARIYRGEDPVRASAFAYPLNPFRWYGLVETTDFFARMEVDSWQGEVDPGGRMEVRYKPEETPVTLAAKRSHLGRVYLDWAQYPVLEIEPIPSGAGSLVLFQDLRFAYPGSGRKTLRSGVEVDRDLNVVDEFWGVPKGSLSAR